MPPSNNQPNTFPTTPPPQAAPATFGAATPPAQPTNSSNSSDKKPVQNKPVSTQNSLLLSEIRESMVIMADGSFRAVVACKSINFDLMSSREREAIEFSYQNFLNALYFPIQILVRSQRVDIGPYLDKLDAIRRNQDNMLLSVLMEDYINFVDVLSQEANIMDKSFFVVIPYFPAGDANTVVEQGKGLFDKIFKKNASGNATTKIDKVAFEKARDEIKNRIEAVASGLSQIGVNAVQLNTKQLGELYYNVYNPDTALREPLGNFSDIASMYVKKGVGDAPQLPTPGGVN